MFEPVIMFIMVLLLSYTYIGSICISRNASLIMLPYKVGVGLRSPQ